MKKTEGPPTTLDAPPKLEVPQYSSPSENNLVEPGTLAKLQRQFQDKLSGLRNLSFLVEDVKVLQDAINIADNLHDALRATCPRVEGLFLRSSPAKNKLKITSIDYHKVFHKKLPLRKKRKKFVSPTNININEDKVRKK